MNISAISCTPIKPQASFGNAQGVDDAQKVLGLTKELGDSFKKENDEPTMKHPVQTAVSILGALGTMFVLGKGAGKGALALLNKAPEAAKKAVKDTAKGSFEYIKQGINRLPKIKNERVSGVLKNTVGRVGNFVVSKTREAIANKGIEKVITTGTGVLAATTLVPEILKADGNKDGIPDIAQNKVNAYASAFKSAEIFADMVNALA